MARKLTVGNYAFDATGGTITVDDNIALERFLLVTNVTRNTIIYDFSRSGLGGTALFNTESEQTTLVLDYDTATAGHADTDKIQILIEEEAVAFTPSEDLIDPVGKFRVSNPGNLIDTDFEYSLQGTKWETIQTVNNIPTVYSSSGDIPIEGIVGVEVTSGSKNVKVTTNIVHNLNIGDPISVQGLDLFVAEGFFIVSAVPDSLTFFFELDVNSNQTGDISGSYTTIVAAKFFEGSQLPISIQNGATTDGLSPSTIDVITNETHGFSAGTKMYVRNTVGPRTLAIVDSSADPAPDGRPYVDTVAAFNTNESIDTTVDTLRGSFRTSRLVAYDWESTYTKYIVTTDVDTVNNTITWTSHNLNNRYTLLFNTPQRDLTVGGLADGRVYWVEVVDADTIKLHTNDSLTAEVDLTTWSDNSGLSRLGLVYRIRRTNGTERTTEFGNAVLSNTTFTASNGSASNAAQTFSINLSQLAGTPGQPVSSASITQLRYRGDFSNTPASFGGTEAVQFWPLGGGSASGSTYPIGSIGGADTSVYRVETQNGWPGTLDITSSLTVNGSNETIWTYRVDPTAQVNFSPGGMPNGWWWQFEFTFNVDVPLNPSASDLENSGSDLFNVGTYGLGSTQPDRVIAFQGRTPGSFTNNNDQYSFLANQRTNGRYATVNPFYNADVTTTSNDGIITVNYNNTVSADLGANSEVFYAFVNVLTNDRNTLYIQNHGIESGSTATITVDATDYSNGQRFAYANSSGNVTTINDQIFTVTVNTVSSDLIRLQINQSPNTDDVVQFPDNFTLSFQRENPTYNTIYLENHKISGSTEAVYTQVGASPIGGLTSTQSYLLNRVTDSRVSLSNTAGSTSSATTTEVGAANNNTQTLFIDLETPLGITPTSASIIGVEFRGDFSGPNEYVLMRFDDGTEYFVGQRDGEDTAIFIPDTTWSVKNVTNILTTNNGNVGINVEFDPTSQINVPFFTPSGNFWEIRFIVAADSGIVILSSTGTGEQNFDIANQVGSYDGIYTINTIPENNEFTLSSDFQIPSRTYDFISSDVSVNVITFSTPHNLITGEKITYNNNGNTSMLPAADQYHAIVVSDTQISIASSFVSAINNSPLTITSQTGTHTISSDNIIKNIKGNGTVSVVSGSNTITGSGTRFLTDFKRFDNIWVVLNGYAQNFTVDQITTNESLTVFETLDATDTGIDYFYATQLILRPDGYGLHKPFDGGVDITAGTSPNSKIVRQTRKYFRYQSGKGIQNSYAINFNPPRIVQNLIQASGTTATVNTQEAHNFVVGDSVTIEKATVSTGANEYNGTFTVTAVPTAFSFQYEMNATPEDVRAGGFPTYTRTSWNDSYIRAGMFDDQNGFFYEFDGQKLYAVRRSSTLQLAGSINVTRGSQVVTGNNTSFTTQIETNDKIVIRGQTYVVVEVSSDARLVVQPAYRGISASKVKITKTVDSRIPQDEWNIDKCDGTGPTGFILDINRIQMAYADYSWYGAGKVRFGFKDQNGHVRYVHEFKHNNRLDESYFRSGNLPARYEIENGPAANTAPTLFHFGTSIIMDGRFDDDKAYLFSSSSKPFAFTNGASRSVTSTAVSSFQLVTIDGSRVFVYAIPVSETDAQATSVGSQIVVNGSSVLPAGTYVTQVRVDGANSLIYTSWPATATEPSGGSFPDIANASTLILGEQTAIDLTEPLPLLSLRLAPSVDSGLTGAVGEREIINRMQLGLKNAGVTSNTAFEVFLILNSLPSDLSFVKAPSPSLSQLIKHSAGDTLINGTTIFSQKSSSGSVDIDLAELLELGNSIQGGDGIFPAGPDLLTLAVQPQDTSQISGTSPFFVSGKINWSESQA
jgi:hypothetical protein